MVADQTFVTVRKHGSGTKHPAKVKIRGKEYMLTVLRWWPWGMSATWPYCKWQMMNSGMIYRRFSSVISRYMRVAVILLFKCCVTVRYMLTCQALQDHVTVVGMCTVCAVLSVAVVSFFLFCEHMLNILHRIPH